MEKGVSLVVDNPQDEVRGSILGDWIGRLLKKTLESVVAVYPCVASTGAPDEYCVYRRAGYEGRNTKDRFNYEERLSLQLSVASHSYERGLEIAQ